MPFYPNAGKFDISPLRGLGGGAQQYMGLQQMAQQNRQRKRIQEIAKNSIDPATGKFDEKTMINNVMKEFPQIGSQLAQSYSQRQKAKTPTAAKPLDEWKQKKQKFDQGTRLLMQAIGSPDPQTAWNDFAKLESGGDVGALERIGPYDEKKALKALESRKFAQRLYEDEILKQADPAAAAKIKRQRDQDEQGYKKMYEGSPKTKSFSLINKAHSRMTGAWGYAQNKIKKGEKVNYGGVDQALITLYNKMLDENSVVRESEYARTPENMAYLDNLKGRIKKVTEGGAGLTNEFRQELIDVAGVLYNQALDVQKGNLNTYIGGSKRYGYDPKFVVGTDAKFLKEQPKSIGGAKPFSDPNEESEYQEWKAKQLGK